MKIKIWLAVALLAISQAACSNSEEGLRKILSMNPAPTGVVFEIASGDDRGLEWAIPIVKSYSKRLREKFPNIKLAVVSHGDEQFQLMEARAGRYAGAQRKVQSLIKEQGVRFHVCGNYASENGVDDDEFVSFIDVADRGPKQVDDYEDAGYEVLFIEKPRHSKSG